MAAIAPLRALHYDLAVAGPLDAVVAPPYDVIDPEQRAALAARSPHNVVEIDLPAGAGRRRPLRARRGDARAPGVAEGAVVRDERARAVGADARTTRRPTARRRTRDGLLARVRVEDYGPGRIRPHERTHPGPEGGPAAPHARHAGQPLADLLALRRPRATPWPRAGAARGRRPVGRGDRRRGHDAPPVAGRRPRRASRACTRRCADAELLIADGHHRYETARVYAEEIGGEGAAPATCSCASSRCRTRA